MSYPNQKRSPLRIWPSPIPSPKPNGFGEENFPTIWFEFFCDLN